MTIQDNALHTLKLECGLHILDFTRVLRYPELLSFLPQNKPSRMWASGQRDGRALPNIIGGGLCSTPHSLTDAYYYSAMQ